MVKVVENHAEISGSLLASEPANDRPGFVALTIRVDAAHAVERWPNLFGQHVGEDVLVLARVDSEAARARPGPLRLRVRKSGPATIYAE